MSAARHRILTTLKRLGPCPASELAEPLAITATAIRQHLSALEEDGLVCVCPESGDDGDRPRGRPPQRWTLTDAGRRTLPDSHGSLTVSLIEAVRLTVGESGLDDVVRAHGSDQVDRYRARLHGIDDLEARVEGLARIRAEEGYLAAAERLADGSFLLQEHHCPICDAARACTGLCANELEVFRAVLGNASVERVAHLLDGDERCTYLIR